MTEENGTSQRRALLIIFGCTFSTIGMAIGTADSYGVLSFTFLGLGILTLLAAVVLEENGSSDEEGQHR
jgi:hypothetical protein